MVNVTVSEGEGQAERAPTRRYARLRLADGEAVEPRRTARYVRGPGPARAREWVQMIVDAAQIWEPGV